VKRTIYETPHHNVYSSSSNIKVVKSRRMEWLGRFVRIRELRYAQKKSWSKKLNERDHLENLGVDGRMKLEWILMK